MKRLASNLPKTGKKLVLIVGGLGALVLAAGSSPQAAQAEVRVSARIQQPGIQAKVVLGQKPFFTVRTQRAHVRLTETDRAIARRLARISGLRKQRILNLRQDGYRWHQIGRMLLIPPRMIHAAGAPYRLQQQSHGQSCECCDHGQAGDRGRRGDGGRNGRNNGGRNGH